MSSYEHISYIEQTRVSIVIFEYLAKQGNIITSCKMILGIKLGLNQLTIAQDEENYSFDRVLQLIK